MMGMTTLLTLSSSFASLATVTPPISYTTRLDIWMVTCIVFVFLTMAEFTLVIILKYYLVNHIPTFCFQHLVRKPQENISPPAETAETNFIEEFLEKNVEKASNTSTIELNEYCDKQTRTITTDAISTIDNNEKTMYGNIDEKEKSFNFKSSSANNISSNDDQYLNEEKQRISQYIVRIIEKNSVIVFLMAFLTFNVVYWRDISLISKEIKIEFDKNNFNGSS